MTTPYMDKDYFAQRRSSVTKQFANWAAYTASENYPDSYNLDLVLDAATEIMNDPQHIGCKSTNITDTAYTTRLKQICYNMVCRMLNIEIQRGSNPLYAYSPGDMLNKYERDLLITIGIEKGYRVIGDVQS